MTRTETTRARLGAAIVAIAPVVLLAGLAYHPHIPYLPDPAAVAVAVAADTARWAAAHLAVGVGSGLAAVAFVAIRSHLRDAGEDRWSALGLPFVIVGSTLYAFLPGMEFVPLAAAKIGADAQAAQAAIAPWFVSVLVTGAVLFALGALGFARAIARSRILSARLTWIVVGGLVVMAAARFVPLGVVQMHVAGLAGVVALWPLAYAMWTQPEAQPAGRPGSVAAA